MKSLIAATLLASLVPISGCGGPTSSAGGSLTSAETIEMQYYAEDGRIDRIERTVRHASAQQPQNPTDGASASVGGTGGTGGGGGAVAALAGGSRAIDHAGIRQAEILTRFGVVLIAVGVGTFVLRKTSIPFAGRIPWSAGLMTAGTGVVLLLWPMIAPIVGALAIVGGICVLLYWIYHNGWFANIGLERKAAGSAGADEHPKTAIGFKPGGRGGRSP